MFDKFRFALYDYIQCMDISRKTITTTISRFISSNHFDIDWFVLLFKMSPDATDMVDIKVAVRKIRL
jgi:hypothetical protein